MRICSPLLRHLLITMIFAATAQINVHGKSIDTLFHHTIQDVYPNKETGLHHGETIGRLPDGRIFSSTIEGKVFVFDGDDWTNAKKKFPAQTTKTLTDSNGVLWIGGEGFFGYIDPSFNYIDISKEHFADTIDSNLPISWIYETEGWIHFSTNKTIYHFNPKEHRQKVTQFEGMFDAYHWITEGKLYLGCKGEIKIWEDDKFEKYKNWKQDHPAFTGWFHNGKEYYLTAYKLYVFEGEKLVQVIKDDLMKLRGADHIKTDEFICIFTYHGLVKMEFDGTCKGFYIPWYHQKITGQSIIIPAYFGGSDIWVLTDFAIARVNLNDNYRLLGIENGYTVTGCWDLEFYKDKLFSASITGFEEWLPEESIFLASGKSPDFETFGIWKAFEQLYISTWVEIGNYDDEYHIQTSDSTFRLFADSSEKDTLWVSADDGVRLIQKDFVKLKTLSGYKGELTSLVEHNQNLWMTTDTGDIYQIGIKPPHTLSIVPPPEKTKAHRQQVFKVKNHLFFQNKHGIYELIGNQFKRIRQFDEEGWNWEVPEFSNEKDNKLLLQRNENGNGCKIGELEIADDGLIQWNYKYLTIEAVPGTIRRLKFIEGLDQDTIAVISPSAIELLHLQAFSNEPRKPKKPKLVDSIGFIGEDPVITNGIYSYHRDQPLKIQLFSPENHLEHVITYKGRIAKRNTDWISNTDGVFEFYGLMKGTFTFEGYTIDPFGNKSDLITHRIRVNPPWYFHNIAILSYVIISILLFSLLLMIQTSSLKRKSEKLEKIVQIRTHDLIQANRAKSIFVSNVSHEIRNPMNGLLGLAQSLKTGDVIDDDILQRLRRPSFYLHRFLSNVLDFSKFESGGIRFSQRVFDPNELLSSLDSMFAGEIKERKLTFTAEYRYTDYQFIVSSQEAIEMILINLVGNAIKYTPVGGNIRVALLQQNESISISVADTGVGIPEDEQKKIFKPFEQGDKKSLIAGEKGTGIGLSLIQNTINELGGKIWLTSLPQQGSTFFVKIPVSNPDQSNIEGVIDQIQLKGKYLVVEDLEYNVKLLANLLRSWGAEVEIAMTGHKAINCSNRNRYDMVFLDYDLPDMNGSDVTKSLRKTEMNHDVIIVGLSAYTDQEFIEKSLSAGMNDFLFKPLNIQKIAESILKQNEKLITYTIKKANQTEDSRVNLNRIKSMSKRAEKNIEESITEYLETFNNLIDSLNQSDLGSKEFESIVHQLKGHCSFINHKPTILYWENVLKNTQNGKRLLIMDDLDNLSAVNEEFVLQLQSLQIIEKDFEMLSEEED